MEEVFLILGQQWDYLWILKVEMRVEREMDIKKLTIDQNKIVSSIQKLSPKAGDVLIFYIKTDEYGTSMINLDAVRQTAEIIGSILEDKGAVGLFLMDKICLFSIDNVDTAIKRLENCISYIREVANQVPDIKNENFGDSVTVEMKEVREPV